jgi:hypothetical protein
MLRALQLMQVDGQIEVIFFLACQHHAHTFRWSQDLAHFLSGFAHSLVRRRLPSEAAPTWRGDPSMRVSTTTVASVAETLVELALAAMHHKSDALRVAAAEVITNFVYFVPQFVLRAVLRRFYEALESSNSTHQLVMAITCLAGV